MTGAAYHDRLAVIIAFTLTSLSTVVVTLRFYSRYGILRKLSPSDWMMLVALIATWGSAVINYYQIHFLDYSKVNSKESYARVVEGHLLSWWIYRISYLLDLCLIKVSILLFYSYVTSVHKSFHRITKTLMVLVIGAAVGMIIAAVLSCNPPADAWSFDVFWSGFEGTFAAQCYNPNILWFFSAAFNLFTDCFIWILPIPFILNLQTMNARRRMELACIFSVGIIAIAASAVRLWVVVLWSSSWYNQGKHASHLLILTQVEQHAGIIAASIPFLRPIFRKILKSKRQREQQASPSPAANLIPRPSPAMQRTPIIPSPSPTCGSSPSPFKVPSSPLSPVTPLEQSDMRVAATV